MRSQSLDVIAGYNLYRMELEKRLMSRVICLVPSVYHCLSCVQEPARTESNCREAGFPVWRSGIGFCNAPNCSTAEFTRPSWRNWCGERGL